MTAQAKPTLGALIRSVRTRYGWTLKEMSQRTGVPFSTLSKVEHDRLTLSYDKLQIISDRLNLPMSELLANPQDPPAAQANSRRSLATLASALSITTPNYDYFYLSPELRNKAMIPVFARLKARSLDEFGSLVRHDGQEFLYVLEGRVDVHTEFYDPVTLGPGEAMYIDSRMGHAYLVADGADHASIVFVCSASQQELLENAVSQGARDPLATRPPAAVRPAAATKRPRGSPREDGTAKPEAPKRGVKPR